MAQKFFANSHLEQAHRLFHFLYSERSNLFLESEEFPIIHSNTGARQGCVTGTLGFCVSIDHLYEEVRKAGGDVVSNAIIDDQSVIGSIENVERAIRKMISICIEENIELNFSKCRILWPYADPVPETVTRLCEEFNFSVVIGAMKLHGGAIGLDNDARTNIIKTKMDKNNKFFSLINHEKFPCQMVPRFLRMSAIPRAQFIAATTPPIVSQNILKSFGNRIIQTFSSKFNIPLPNDGDDVDFILRAPVSQFGWGLKCPAKLAPAAFLASLTRSISFFSNTLSYKVDGDNLIPSVQEAVNVIDYVIQSLPQLDRDLLPTVNMETGLLVAPKKVTNVSLQRLINLSMQSENIQTVLSTKSRSFINKINELKDSSVKRFHSIILSRNELSINNLYYPLVARHMLGLAPADDLPAQCFCGKPLTDPSHFHVCKFTRANTVGSRHNKCVITIGKLVELAGGDFEREPMACEENNKRLDALIYLPSGVYAIDVSVVHSSSPSYVNNRLSHISLINGRNLCKNNKYLERCKKDGILFSPFALTSCGALSPVALDILTKIAECAESNGVASKQSFMHRAVDELLVALHKGNARIASSGTSTVKRLRPRQPPAIECFICTDKKYKEAFPVSEIGCACTENEKQKMCTECLLEHYTVNSSHCPMCRVEITQLTLYGGEEIPIEYKIPRYVPDEAEELQAAIELDRNLNRAAENSGEFDAHNQENDLQVALELERNFNQEAQNFDLNHQQQQNQEVLIQEQQILEIPIVLVQEQQAEIVHQEQVAEVLEEEKEEVLDLINVAHDQPEPEAVQDQPEPVEVAVQEQQN
jgi:hypothetical protein